MYQFVAIGDLIVSVKSPKDKDSFVDTVQGFYRASVENPYIEAFQWQLNDELLIGDEFQFCTVPHWRGVESHWLVPFRIITTDTHQEPPIRSQWRNTSFSHDGEFYNVSWRSVEVYNGYVQDIIDMWNNAQQYRSHLYE